MFPNGDLGYIVDRDLQDNAYLVCPLADYYKYETNIGRMLDSAFWVSESNMEAITFKKEKHASLLQRISRLVNSRT